MTTIEVKKIGAEEMKVLDGMPLITIYKNPADYPGKFIARLFDIKKGKHRPTEIVVVADNLFEIRKKIPREQMFIIDRDPQDDPCIVEMWI